MNFSKYCLDIKENVWYCVVLKKGSGNTAKRRPNGDGMIRKRTDGRWEGRIVAGHKNNGKPIYRSVLAKTQKELTEKLHTLIETHKNSDLTEESTER